MTAAEGSAGEGMFPTLHWRAAAAWQVVHSVQLGRHWTDFSHTV